jgi:hypothetical protein
MMEEMELRKPVATRLLHSAGSSGKQKRLKPLLSWLETFEK